MGFFSSIFSSSSKGELVEPYDAPTPPAVDQDGSPVNLAEVYAKGTTLVYFYPKAGTPGCTKQACSLRDAYEELKDEGITVIGVSTDKAAAQKQFAERQRLPFALLADPEGRVVEAFKVKRIPFVGISLREAFLVQGGKVVWHDAQGSTTGQAADVLRVVRGELAKQPPADEGGTL